MDEWKQAQSLFNRLPFFLNSSYLHSCVEEGWFLLDKRVDSVYPLSIFVNSIFPLVGKKEISFFF